jgi:hypothetical protein
VDLPTQIRNQVLRCIPCSVTDLRVAARLGWPAWQFGLIPVAGLEPEQETTATGRCASEPDSVSSDLAWLLAVGFDVQIGTRDQDGRVGYVIRLGDAPGWDGPYETPGAALAAERKWAESPGHAPPLAV